MFTPETTRSSTPDKFRAVANDRAGLVSPDLEPLFSALDTWRENPKMIAFPIYQSHCLDRPGPFFSVIFVLINLHFLRTPLYSVDSRP
jgi:hypothetical protein